MEHSGAPNVTDPRPTSGADDSGDGAHILVGIPVASSTNAAAGATEGPALGGPALEDAAPAREETGSVGREKRSPSSKTKKGAGRVFLEWVVLIVVALGIAFLIKSFLFQAFYIPSESMTPTLQVGDRVLVNKLSYDLHDVNRGDIVVFEAPSSARTEGIKDLVKRTIGLPGDTITGDGRGGVLVNGRRLDEPYLPKGTQSRFSDVAPGCKPPPAGVPGCVVPEGHLFMMGDNREASKDSRVFGPINENAIVGRVFVRIWPLSDLGLL
jgi:signal peptidase I